MYIDPGFAGMLLQVLIAAAAAGGAIAFAFRRKIRAFFSKKKGGTDSVAPQAGGDAEDVIDMLESETPPED